MLEKMLRYKACRNSIVTLELLDDTKTNEKRDEVVNDKYAKFRCNKVKVLNIKNVKTGKNIEMDGSIYNPLFCYQVGEIVTTSFNTNINLVCATGIHYFKTKEAAVSWFYRETGNTLPDGKWTVWRENGNKSSEGTYKDGEKNGEWVHWGYFGEKIYSKDMKRGLCMRWSNY